MASSSQTQHLASCSQISRLPAYGMHFAAMILLTPCRVLDCDSAVTQGRGTCLGVRPQFELVTAVTQVEADAPKPKGIAV